MEADKILEAMKQFFLWAGPYAIEQQKNCLVSYKEAQQVVTSTDLEISRRAPSFFEDWLSRDDHILVDEESANATPERVFAPGMYQWAIDPIDGTAGYALGRSLWGITMGVLKDGLPVAGGIFLPRMGQMILSNETNAWLIQNALSSAPTQSPLELKKLSLNRQIFVETYFCNGLAWGNKWHPDIWPNTPESAIQGFSSALLGQAAGATFIPGFSLWDIAGAFVIAKALGYTIQSMEGDDRSWDRMTAGDFDENWKLDQAWLLCHPDNFSAIKQSIRGD